MPGVKAARAAVDGAIREDRVCETLMDLVRIASVNPPGGEAPVAEYLARRFAALGLPGEVKEIEPGRPNFVGRLAGSPGGRRLVFNTHLDVVPAGGGWSRDAFDPWVQDGKIYGRGSCDPKGCLAAMLHAIEAVHAAGVRLAGEVVLAGAMDEEVSSLGTRAMAADLGADMAVVGEPTNCDVCVAHKGSCRPVAVVAGRSAHAAEPGPGVNAITGAIPLLAALERYGRQLRRRRHRLVGSPTAVVTMIQGGTKANMVPDRCEILVDRRLIPGETQEDVRAEVEAVFASLRAKHPALDVRIGRFGPTTGGPSETDARDPLVLAGLKSVSRVLGRRARPRGFTLNCDMGIFREHGVPCLILGPGDPKLAHQPDEFVPVDQLVAATRIYAGLMLDGLGLAEGRPESGSTGEPGGRDGE
jgi:acetylornithine deacetylase/succinyl-diaminopimelate desuccinylase family protein